MWRFVKLYEVRLVCMAVVLLVPALLLGLAAKEFASSAWSNLASAVHSGTIGARMVPRQKAMQAPQRQLGAFDHLLAQPQKQHTGRQALASMCISDTEVAEVVTLAYTLRMHNNTLPLVLFYLEGEGFTEAGAALAQQAGWALRKLEYLQPFVPGALEKFKLAYTKLRIFELEADYDIILYMDLDIVATGRIEAALDLYAPNGSALEPVAAARNPLKSERRANFNAGVMLVQPSREFYADLLRAGRAGQLHVNGRLAEQAFLNAFLNTRGLKSTDEAPQKWSWLELPAACNLMPRTHNHRWFERRLPRALLVHFAGVNKWMRGHVHFDEATGSVVNTTWPLTDQYRADLWIEAWTEAARVMGLPKPAMTDRRRRQVVWRVDSTAPGPTLNESAPANQQ